MNEEYLFEKNHKNSFKVINGKIKDLFEIRFHVF